MSDVMHGRGMLCSVDSRSVSCLEQPAQYYVDPFDGIGILSLSIYAGSDFTMSAIFVLDCSVGSSSLLSKCKQDQCGGANGYGRMICIIVRKSQILCSKL